MKVENSLYHTFVQNHNGLKGTTVVEGNEGWSLGVSSSLIKAPGTNPEQLLGFAIATCFNGTLRLIQRREHTAEDSQLRVRVDIVKDAVGYKFIIDAQVRMPKHSSTDAERLVSTALAECPVAKIVKQDVDVNFRVVDRFEDDETEPAYGE